MAYRGSVKTDIFPDEILELLCNVCKHKGKYKVAERYCLECNDYYCSTCVKVHAEIPSLMGHNFLNEALFQSGSVKKNPRSSNKRSTAKPGSSTQVQSPALSTRCDDHSHHYIDMYCQNHDDVGCGTCMAMEHRLCKDVFYIPDFLKNNPNASRTEEIKDNLKTIFNTLKVQHRNLQLETQKVLTRKAKTIENIRKFRKEMNDRLDELEKTTLSLAQDNYKSLVNLIKEAMDLLDTNKTQVSLAKQKLEDTCHNVLQDFIHAKKGESTARTAAKCQEDSMSLLYTDDVEFIPEQKLMALLQDIDELGKIEQRSTEAVQVTGEYRIPEVREKNRSAADTVKQLLKVKGNMKESVVMQSDNVTCHIVSACSMEDGTLILCDRDNSKLKCLDSSKFTITGHYDLPVRPWQVCPTDKQQVAVSLPRKKQINFITVSNKMTINKKITTDFGCYGVAFSNGNIYISDSKTSVYIYSASGEKLKEFSADQSGQRMFSDIRSLAVNEEGSRIYVTDLENGLIVLDSNGQVVRKYCDYKLDGASGSCLTDRGGVLVCGKYSNNVLQFGQNGDLIGEVVKATAVNTAICCNKQMTKMINGGCINEI